MEQLIELAEQNDAHVQADLFEEIELLSDEDLAKVGGGQAIIFL